MEAASPGATARRSAGGGPGDTKETDAPPGSEGGMHATTSSKGGGEGGGGEQQTRESYLVEDGNTPRQSRKRRSTSSSMASNDGGNSEEEEEEEASAGAPNGDVTVPVAYAPTPATKSRTLTRRRSALMQSTESDTISEHRMGARIVQEFAAVHLVDFVQRMLHEVDCDWDLTPFNQELETVAIFLDVSGFTKLTECLSEEGSVGSEKLGFFLNRYFERINKLLSKGGGDIMKFAGDAMIIFWQAEHDQHGKLDRKLMALKATQAALQLQEELHGAELADGVEFSVKMGIGVGGASILHVGGERDRVEIVPCGEALMQAFAGENQCSPGQTVVSPEVWTLISDSFSGTKLKSGSTAVNSNTKRVRNISIKRPLLSSSHEIKQLQRYVPASIIPFLQTHLSWMTEVREVTTIFVNLGLDPHDLVATTPKRLQRVQDIFRGVQREAYRVEASVNKFIVDDKGTTVLVALGLPLLSNLADPARGVAFALRIVRVLRGLDPRGKRYIGVTTGTALCGPVGSGSRKEYTLLGDSVNVSARLMQAAKDPHTNLCKSVGYIGNIVCDESTRNACKELVHDFVFHPVGEIMLKGKTHATCCFQPGWATLHNERALIRRISSSQKLARELPPVAETWRLRYIDVLFAMDNFFNSDGKHPAAATMFCTNAAEARETMDLTCMQLWEDRNAEPYYVLNDEVVSITELHNDFKMPTMGVPLTFSSRNSSNRSMHGSSRSSQGSGRAFNSAAKGIQGGSGRTHYGSGRSSPGSGRGMQAPKWIQHLTRQLSHTLLLRTNAFLGDSLLQGAPVWRRILQGVVALAKVREVTVDTSVLAHPCFSTWPMAYAAATFQPDETEYTFSDDDFDQVIDAISALLQTMVAANFSLVLTIEDAHHMPPMDWKFTRRISEHMLSHQRDRHTRPAYQANMEVVHERNNAEKEDMGTKLEGANSIVSAQSSNKSLSGVSSVDSMERKASQRDSSYARRRSSIFQQAIPFSGVFLLVSLIPPHSVARRPKSAGLEESYVGFVQSMQTIIVEHQPLTLLEANALILSHLQVTQVSAGLTKTLYRIIGGNRDRLIACLDALCAAGFVEGLASQGNPNVKGPVLRRSSSGIRLTAKRPSQNMVLPEEKVRLVPMSFKQRLHALSICSDCCNTRWEAQILDRLSVAEKIVLRCASILANGLGPFGLHFDLGMLVAIYPFKEVDPDVTIMPSVEASKDKKPPSVTVDEGVLFKLETRLQRLLQVGVIKEVHRPLYTEDNASAALRHEDHCPYFRVDSSAGDTFESRRGRERCFSFCDVIMRRKVYREMLLAHRKRLHQTVIQVLEKSKQSLRRQSILENAKDSTHLQVQAMILFHMIGAKQLQGAHDLYHDALKNALEIRLPPVKPDRESAVQSPGSTESMKRKKSSMPRLHQSSREASNESKSQLWASVRRRPSSMLGDVLAQSFQGSTRRDSGSMSSGRETFQRGLPMKDANTQLFVETLRSIRQATRKTSMLRAQSIRSTLNVNEAAPNDDNSAILLDVQRHEQNSTQDKGNQRHRKAMPETSGQVHYHEQFLGEQKEGMRMQKGDVRWIEGSRWWTQMMRSCLPWPGCKCMRAPLDHEDEIAHAKTARPKSGLMRGPSALVLGRMPSMNVVFSKAGNDQDKEWDECLENAPMQSTSRENLVAFLRQNPDVEQAGKQDQHVKSSESDRQSETRRNTNNTSVGLRMRGMRWSIKTRSSNSSKVQAAAMPQQAARNGDPPMSRAASADSHLENRRKLSSFKLRLVRNTQSAEDRKRRRISSDTVKHALFIYSDPIAVETWSRRMNFQERDALSALALQLDAWSFDIFSFERVACGTPLHMMLRLLFLKHGFYELFEFNISMVDRFAQEIERLYPANPYHNSTHAADVVQACHVFLLQLHQRKLVLRSDGEEAEVQMSSSAQDFLSALMTGTSLVDEDEDSSDNSQVGTLPARRSARDNDSPEFSKLDRLTMLLAAAVHDIGHPGVNASFLKATGNALCEQFADPVLENFHAATARPLIEALLEGELDQVRTTIQPLVTRLVLSTSVENHTAFVDKLNRRMDLLASASAHASDLQHSRCSLSTASSSHSLSDLVDMDKDAGAMMMELIIKCADVSNCARELPTYKLWVTRISEEFIGQTELERHVGVPVTTFMASFDPQMQLGFINNIAFPLFDVLARLCPEATEQRDYVMTNYSFYQKGKDTSAPGVLRTPPQSDASTQRLLQNQLMNSSSKDSKYSSETLKQSFSKINMVSSTMSRSNTASMKVRPQTRLGSTTSRSASVIFTSERLITEMSHARSYDRLSSSLPGAVIEEEEGVSHEQAM